MEIYKAIGYEFLIAFYSFLLKKLARKIGRQKDTPSDDRDSLFALKRCNRFDKMHRYTIPFPIHFINQVATILRGIFIIPFLHLVNFFSFHICDQRKEAKERRLIRKDI